MEPVAHRDSSNTVGQRVPRKTEAMVPLVYLTTSAQLTTLPLAFSGFRSSRQKGEDSMSLKKIKKQKMITLNYIIYFSLNQVGELMEWWAGQEAAQQVQKPDNNIKLFSEIEKQLKAGAMGCSIHSPQKRVERWPVHSSPARQSNQRRYRLWVRGEWGALQ